MARSGSASATASLRGFKKAPIQDVRLSDCDLKGIARNSVIENVENVGLRDVLINGEPAGNGSGESRLQANGLRTA